MGDGSQYGMASSDRVDGHVPARLEKPFRQLKSGDHMKALFLAVALIAGLAAVPVRAAAVDAGIRKTIDGFAAAWDKHDPDLMVSYWLEDSDLIDPNGRAFKGRAELIKFFAEQQSGPFKNSSMAMRVTAERILAKDLVLVDAEATIKNAMLPDGKIMDCPNHVVFVFRKETSGWKIVSARPYVFQHAADAK
jgi:uncharacterized protein (TIGR02246 family)